MSKWPNFREDTADVCLLFSNLFVFIRIHFPAPHAIDPKLPISIIKLQSTLFLNEKIACCSALLANSGMGVPLISTHNLKEFCSRMALVTHRQCTRETTRQICFVVWKQMTSVMVHHRNRNHQQPLNTLNLKTQTEFMFFLCRIQSRTIVSLKNFKVFWI